MVCHKSTFVCFWVQKHWSPKQVNTTKLRPSDAHMCHQTRPSLVQIMACRLLGATPLLEPMLIIVNWTLATGLFFSRPKPVFPVQNGINLFFPSQTWKNWKKLCRTIFKARKSFQKCDLSNKNLTRQTRSSFDTYCSYDLWTHNPNLMNSNFCCSSSNTVGSDLSS